MIKYLIMDVDGTLTDGKIYMGKDGEIAKAFNIKDGAGITVTLPKNEIIPVIITARESKILENRCSELKITELYQGSKDKLKTLNEVVKKYNASLDSVAYAGDDLPDIPCMECIKKAGGIVVCPADAVPEIREIADYVSGFNAGEGAIRDCINYLVSYNAGKERIEEQVERVILKILAGEYGENSMIDGNPFTIKEYNTKKESDCIIETHRNHIDIQYIIEGKEAFKIYGSNGLTSMGVYRSDIDTEYWHNGFAVSYSILTPGSLIVVYNNQAFKEAIQCGDIAKVKKLVCRIEV